jgi:hypothetical protein
MAFAMSVDGDGSLQEGIVEYLVTELLIHRCGTPAISVAVLEAWASQTVASGGIDGGMAVKIRAINDRRRTPSAPNQDRTLGLLQKAAGENVLVVHKRDCRNGVLLRLERLADDSLLIRRGLLVLKALGALFSGYPVSVGFSFGVFTFQRSKFLSSQRRFPPRLLLKSNVQHPDVPKTQS